MLERMGFDDEAANVRHVWRGLYRPAQGHRIPVRLLETSSRTIPQVVDEIAFQTRRNLAQSALVDIIPFKAEDERFIRRTAASLARGVAPSDVPPRFLVSASRYAIGKGAQPSELARIVIDLLAGKSQGLQTKAIPVAAA
jgi:hypothetical protein